MALLQLRKWGLERLSSSLQVICLVRAREEVYAQVFWSQSRALSHTEECKWKQLLLPVAGQHWHLEGGNHSLERSKLYQRKLKIKTHPHQVGDSWRFGHCIFFIAGTTNTLMEWMFWLKFGACWRAVILLKKKNAKTHVQRRIITG